MEFSENWEGKVNILRRKNKKGNNELGPAAKRARAEWPPSRVQYKWYQRRQSWKAEGIAKAERCASSHRRWKHANAPASPSAGRRCFGAPCSAPLLQDKATTSSAASGSSTPALPVLSYSTATTRLTPS